MVIRKEKTYGKLLTIIIPTYNRSEQLDVCLNNLHSLSNNFVFDIIVCDNGSEDNTKEVLDKWECIIPYIKTVRHRTNILYDRNVASGYLEVATPYCWVLGDSSTIDSDNFDHLLNFLADKRPQAVIINDASGNVKIRGGVYRDANALLRDLGWHITLLSSCIISKNFITPERCKRYYDTWFIHEGVFFDYLACCDDVEVYLEPQIHPLLLKVGDVKRQNSWRKTPFYVFGKCWFSFVISLPNLYKIENKLFCIKQHDVNRKIFSPWSIFLMKLNGYTSFSDYKDARPYLKYVLNSSIIYFDIIAGIPSMPKFYRILRDTWRKVTFS